MSTERQLQELRQLVEKQKQTIKTQSETISGGWSGGKGHAGYSRPSAPPVEYHRTPLKNQPPPPFELPRHDPNPSPLRYPKFGSDMQQMTNLSLNSTGEDVFVQGQTQSNQDSTLSLASLSMNAQSPNRSTPFHGAHHHSAAWPSQAVAPSLPRPENFSTPSKHVGPISAPRTPDPASMKDGAFAGTDFTNAFLRTPHCGGSSLNLGELVHANDEAADHGFARKLAYLFRMAERYCYSHMNFPSASKDAQLPAHIKERLMKAATRESAHQLGSTGSTRYLLMTKVILQWFAKHVFTQSLFAGFDNEADCRIAACKDQIYQGRSFLAFFSLPRSLHRYSLTRSHTNLPPTTTYPSPEYI
jgi:hypothetical protein